MHFDKQFVKILLVGDDSAGKTSLVIALTTEESPLLVPSKAHDLYITGELTSQSIPAVIVDTCTTEQSEKEIIEEIIEADVICMVYSLVEPGASRRISDYWLPLIQNQVNGVYKPVIIIGNKCDLVKESLTEDDCEMYFMKEKFSQVEGYFTVSALELLNIVETFQFAQKTVLHPLRPLMDFETKELSPLFVRALFRIFRIFDSNSDGIITWQEMLDFQKVVFKNLLYRQTLQDLRDTISQYIPDGLTHEGFTLNGFLFIHKLFIMRGMRDSLWKVLTTFGYNIKLELDESYLFPCYNIGPKEYAELNRSGIKFLKTVFDKYDKDHDNCITWEEFNNIFVDFDQHPFPLSFVDQYSKDIYGNVTLEKFISLFVRATHTSPNITLSVLSVLGYSRGEWHGSLGALQTASPLVDHEYNSQLRTTFVCSVFGNYECGKTSLLRAFDGYPFEEGFSCSSSSFLIIKHSMNSQKEEIFIIFEEVPWYKVDEFMSNRSFDMAIFVYDANDNSSFEFCREIHADISISIPSVFIGTKTDLGFVKQMSETDPKAYCNKYLKHPLIFCSVKNDNIITLEQTCKSIISIVLSSGSETKPKGFFFFVGVFVLLTGIGLASVANVYRKIRS